MTKSYATLITTNGRANKLITRSVTPLVTWGTTKKAGPPIGNATGVTINVPDCESMATLLRRVAGNPNQVLVPSGYFPETEPNTDTPLAEGPKFKVASAKFIAEQMGIDHKDREKLLGWHLIKGERHIARLKNNVLPTIWMLFDRDEVKGMPEHLASMSDDEWLNAMSSMIPGLNETSVVKVPSSTGRVLIDGLPMSATGRHYYVPIEDGYDLERFGKILLQRSFLNELGFMSTVHSKENPEKVVRTKQCSIFDVSTFSPERIVYEGAPTLEGQDLTLDSPNIEVISRENKKIDTSLLLNLTKKEIAKIKADTGCNVQTGKRNERVLDHNGTIVSRGVPTVTVTDDKSLKHDTVIETEYGSMTLASFWGSSHQKARCQATFRESTSMNGFLSFHEDFTPFLLDNGSDIKYILSKDDSKVHMAQAWISRLSLMQVDEIEKCWPSKLRVMDVGGQQKVIEWVNQKTKTTLTVLRARLKEEDINWKSEQVQAWNDKVKSTAEDDGRTPIIYDPVNLGGNIKQVESAIFKDQERGLVFTHSQNLVTVCNERPKTVREVNREITAKEGENPLGLRIERYSQNKLELRLSESCTFFRENKLGVLAEIPVPSKLAQTMLEVSQGEAPALVGIIDHPALKSDCSLIQGQGYDQHTGLYACVPDGLVPKMPQTITKQMATDSLKWICDNVFDEFPFDSDLDQAGAVAMLLTAVQRRLMTGSEGAPMFATSSPVQSSGKTTLIQLVSYLVQGHGLPVTSWPTNEEEMGKHLLSILMGGAAIVLFDNLPEAGRIESNKLASACTSEKFRNRCLGENREVEVPTNVVWCFTGNNIQPVGDFNTRLLNIYLDPNSESPDRRSFKRNDIEAWCLDNRADFFYHSLIILAGYMRASRNIDLQKPKPTRFHDWDRQVREPMIWAGSPDPAELFDRNKADDPFKAGREELIETWFKVYGEKPVLLKNVLIDCNDHGSKAKNGGLDIAISDLVPHDKLTSRSFSSLLQKFVNQWIGDYRLQKVQNATKSKHAAMWFVECKQKDQNLNDDF